MRKPSLCLAIFGLALLLCAGRASADYESLYVLGLKAVDYELWADGVILFSKAIDEREQAGGLVRPYGTWTESYVPHYYLGLCLFHLARYADALDAWEKFEAQPPAGYPRNRPKQKTVEELRRSIPGLLPQEIERLRAEIVAAQRLLANLEDDALLLERGEGSKSDLGIATELLEEAARAIEDSTRTVDLADVLRGIRPMVAEAKEKIGEQSSQVARLRRQETIARELDARREQRERYREALGLLQDGACSNRAIELLVDIVHRSSLDPADLGADAAPVLRLANAHLLCGEMERAAQYLEMARHDVAEGAETVDLLDRVAAELAKATESESGADLGQTASAHNLYAQASSWIDIGECRQEVVEQLEEVERHLLVEEDGKWRIQGSPPFPYTPFLAKARALWNCRDLAGAETSLELARGLGVAPESELDALAKRLEEAPMRGRYGGSHALVVVAHDYQHEDEAWNDLPGARADVEAIRHALATHGFTVDVVENPLADVLERKIKKFIARYGRNPQNRIVIYWAGHGWTEEAVGIKRGYVVPVDSPHPERTDESFEYLVSMGTFELHARPMLARHALFIFDTCFGGMVFDRSLGETSSATAETESPASELLTQPVRMFMSAGDESQSVPDFSVFRRTLVRGLSGEADADGDELILGRELGDFVRGTVAETSYTTPRWGVMEGGDLGNGDIGFQSQRIADESASRRLRTENRFWTTVWGSASASRYRTYLEIYPDGAFAPLASLRLEQLAK